VVHGFSRKARERISDIELVFLIAVNGEMKPKVEKAFGFLF
jgi:hypothetical protein